MNSWLNIYKPRSISSAKLVSIVKKSFPKVKIGHAGTLDPEAEGVLPLALGEATKLINFLMDAKKEYFFTIQFGARSDTGDSAGKIIETCEGFPKQKDCARVLEKFMGEIEQVPPAYSAIKINGKRAYDLARKGVEFEIKSRKVHIYSIKLESFNHEKGQATIRVLCSKGTYVRTLAEDISLSLQNLGYVIELRRSRVGIFHADDALDISSFVSGDWADARPVLLAGCEDLEKVLDDIPVVDVSNDEAYKIRCGQKGFAFEKQVLEDIPLMWIRHEGKLLSIGCLQQGVFKSKRVFNL